VLIHLEMFLVAMLNTWHDLEVVPEQWFPTIFGSRIIFFKKMSDGTHLLCWNLMNNQSILCCTH